MLTQLCIRNLGLLAAVDLEFGPGLQIVTGGTGAGKSMLLGALDILGGVRAKTEWIRDGEEEASISGFFVIDDPEARRAIEEQIGIDLEDGELRVERRLRRVGRHRTRINSQEIPLSMLQAIRGHLLDVHGQQAQFALLKPAEQLRALDSYGGLTDEQREFARDYRRLRKLAAEIDAARSQHRARHDRRLYLEHVVEELDDAALRPSERDELERDLAFLEERDQILRTVQGTLEELHDDEQSVTDRLGQRIRRLAPYADLSDGVKEFVDAAESALAALDEAVGALRGVEDEVSQDPGELEMKRERFDLLSRLEEKYQRPVSELCDYLEESRRELEALVSDETSFPEREAELRRGLDDLSRRADVLSKKRREISRELARRLRAELDDLGLADAVWEARFEPLAVDESTEGPSSSENSPAEPVQADEAVLDLSGTAWLGLGEMGADRLEMMFGPNPGESLRPLRQVASGGELSRVMLALKRVLAAAERVGTVVFDEIDSGVGGRLGTEIGRKLAEISVSHQVFCVTHLPQVACYGDRHYHVEKRQSGTGSDARTVTEVVILDEERRTVELASMLRGSGRTETSLREAQEMLAEAQRRRVAPSEPMARRKTSKKKKKKTARRRADSKT